MFFGFNLLFEAGGFGVEFPLGAGVCWWGPGGGGLEVEGGTGGGWGGGGACGMVGVVFVMGARFGGALGGEVRMGDWRGGWI